MTTSPTRPPRVLNKHHGAIPKAAVYIGRPGKWGNPFGIGKDGNRAEVIAKYRAYLEGNSALMAALPELRGKDLVCFCAPAPCHGDILLSMANDRAPARASEHQRERQR
jgi:hypothetical protein